MPLYEYFCNACNTPSEIAHKMSDPPATICPVCGKPALVKQMSAAGFRLKGSGWYETDFKSGNKKNLADSSASGDAAGAPKAASTESTKAATPAPSSTPPAST